MAKADTYAKDLEQEPQKPGFIKKTMRVLGGIMTTIIDFFISLF